MILLFGMLFYLYTYLYVYHLYCHYTLLLKHVSVLAMTYSSYSMTDMVQYEMKRPFFLL